MEENNTDNALLKNDIRDTEKRLSDAISENRAKILLNSEAIAELRAMYRNLADLPNTINSLDRTIVKVCDRLDNMDENLTSMRRSIQSAMKHNNEQDSRIDEVDNKSKIDWAKAISENFWKITLAFGVFYYVLKDFFR